jgi:hypothetical protein
MMRCARVLLAALLLAASASVVSAQTSGSSRPMSATVIASYVTTDGELTLLVLWRGIPGWYSRGSGGRSGSGGGNREVFSSSDTYGGKTLSVEVNYTSRTARVLGQTISLDEANVLLVDDVDAASGGRIVGRDRVAMALPGLVAGATLADDPFVVAIRRSASAGAFLQCDVPLPLPDTLATPQIDAATRARIAEYVQGAMTQTCRAAMAP